MATVLVTGANRGIGLELVRQLRRRGDHVLAACRTASPELHALGAKVLPGVDVGVDAVVGRLREAVGDEPIDVVVNNAGILRPDNLSNLDFGVVREELETNALGPLRVTVALRANLRSGSKIAIITSRVGSIGDNSSGGMYGYRMSKAAVNMAGVNLAIELRSAGIAVGLFHPGMVATEMTRHGGIPVEEAATNVLARIDGLTMTTSGKFFHANGQELPW